MNSKNNENVYAKLKKEFDAVMGSKFKAVLITSFNKKSPRNFYYSLFIHSNSLHYVLFKNSTLQKRINIHLDKEEILINNRLSTSDFVNEFRTTLEQIVEDISKNKALVFKS